MSRGPTWPFGTYELVSFNGQSLPAELSDGRMLNSGELTLSEGVLTGQLHRREGVGFSLSFSYPTGRYVREEARSWHGGVSARQNLVEGSRVPLGFEVVGFYSGANSWVYSGFDEFPLDWADPRVASGTLFGNELRMGDGEKLLVFMRR
jgi:hypothetical protein